MAKRLGELIKRSAKSRRQRGEKFTKKPRLARIGEIEGACALLEGLHSLCGWVSKTCRMKRFIRAKGLGDLQHAETNNTSSRTTSALCRSLLCRWMETRPYFLIRPALRNDNT